MEPKRSGNGMFRLLLGLGAVVSVAIGIWGVVWTGMLETVLGLDVPRRALGVARLYGGVMLAVGIGYALAAAQPERNRSLLVPLFLVPLMSAGVTIAAIARDEILTGRGIGYAVFGIAYCLFYFRLYPRLEPPEEPSGDEEVPSPSLSPESPNT